MWCNLRRLTGLRGAVRYGNEVGKLFPIVGKTDDSADGTAQSIANVNAGVPLFQEQLLRMAMIVANFSGREAEDLRRARGFKRSEKRMQEVEAKIRAGMTQIRWPPASRNASFNPSRRLPCTDYPRVTQASFALRAYASAYLKCNYLAALPPAC